MEFIRIIQRMDRLIQLKSTGSPEDFASRLSISERSLYNYLGVMKELGAPLRYSRIYGSYEYLEKGRFLFEFKKQLEPEYAE